MAGKRIESNNNELVPTQKRLRVGRLSARSTTLTVATVLVLSSLGCNLAYKPATSENQFGEPSIPSAGEENLSQSFSPENASVPKLCDLDNADSPEMHAVGVYEGDKGHYVTVTVSRNTRPVLLVLTAYEDTEWKVNVEKGANLVGIIASGYEPQTLTDLSDTIPTDIYSYEAGSPLYFFADKTATAEFVSMKSHLKTLTGCDLSSFQGNYSQGTFEISNSTPLLKKPDTTNTSDQYSEKDAVVGLGHFRDPMSGSGVITKYSLVGKSSPILSVSEQLESVAYTPERDQYFGVTNHEFGIIDPAGKFAKKTPPRAFEEVSWTTGVTYDTKRKRAVFATLGGKGFLYGYSPGNVAWHNLGGLDDYDLGDIVYMEAQDMLYADYEDFSEESASIHSLLKVSPKGGIDGKLELTQEIKPYNYLKSPGEYSKQLYALDDEIILVIRSLTDEVLLFSIDPENGETQLIRSPES